MKRTCNFAAIVLAASVAALSSCVNEDYDLNNLDSEMTLVPGLSLNVNQKLNECYTTSLIGIQEGGIIAADANGDLKICTASQSKDISVPQAAFSAGTSVSIDETITVDFPNIPDFFDAAGSVSLDLADPVLTFTVTNPTSTDVKMTAVATADSRNVNIECNLPANASDQVVRVSNSEVSKLFNPVPKTVTIHDIKFTKLATGTTSVSGIRQTDAASTYTFKIACGTDTKLSFNPGAKIACRYVLDLENQGLNFGEIQDFTADDLSLKFSVENSIPFDFNLKAQGIEAENGAVQATVGFDKPIAAGKDNKAVKSDIRMDLKCTGEISKIKKIVLDMSVENNSNGVATLNKGQGFTITMESITLNSGITVTL